MNLLTLRECNAVQATRDQFRRQFVYIALTSPQLFSVPALTEVMIATL